MSSVRLPSLCAVRRIGARGASLGRCEHCSEFIVMHDCPSVVGIGWMNPYEYFTRFPRLLPPHDPSFHFMYSLEMQPSIDVHALYVFHLPVRPLCGLSSASETTQHSTPATDR